MKTKAERFEDLEVWKKAHKSGGCFMGLLKAYNRQQRSRQHVVNSIQGKRKKLLSPIYCLLSTKKKISLSTTYRLLSTEKGIALMVILILAAIGLLIMAGLIYMVTMGTQISGMQKRYKTALEAGIGGAEVTYQFIALRGDATDTSSLLGLLTSMSPTITTPSGCTGTDISGLTFTGLSAKLNTPTTSWSSGCDSSMSITPGTVTSYDMRFDLGTSPYPTYRVYAKLVDTVEGNSAPDKGLGGKGVVTSASSEVTVVSMPYLYTLELDAQNLGNPSERAKLSVLYQY